MKNLLGLVFIFFLVGFAIIEASQSEESEKETKEINKRWWSGRRRRRSPSPPSRHTINGNINNQNAHVRYTYRNRNGNTNVNAGANYNHQNGNAGGSVGVSHSWGKRNRFIRGQLTIEERYNNMNDDLSSVKAVLSKIYPPANQITLPKISKPMNDRKLAEDMTCLVHEIGDIFPQIEEFVMKMVKTHAAKYGQSDLPQTDTCKSLIPDAEVDVPLLDGNVLVSLKKFTSTLIFTAFELNMRKSN